MRFKDEVDWVKLWDKLENPTICNGEECINLTEAEQSALTNFAKFIAKMNPPEDDRILAEIRRSNDDKFKTFIEEQFRYLEY